MAADGDTTELGIDTEAPVFTGTSESPRLRLGAPSREDPPPRATGADTAGGSLTGADTAGASLTGTSPTGTSLPATSPPTGSAEPPTERPLPTAVLPVPVAEGSVAASCAGAPRRAPERCRDELSDREEDEEEDAESVFDPDEPPEPVVSANANGTEATADPTPNTTANAPTRPTYRA